MSNAEPRVLVLDQTGELAARIRHNAVSPRATVEACTDAARAETLLSGAAWDALVAGPSVMHQGGLRRTLRRAARITRTRLGVTMQWPSGAASS